MNHQEEQLFSLIAADVPLTILSELIKEKELTIYDLNDNINSVAQYRYALQKLLANNIIQSRKEKRKCYYSLSPTFKDKIKSLVSCYLSFNRGNILKILQNFDGWAFRGKSALLLYVPFLTLVSSKYTISVRSIKEQKKLEQLIPEIGSLFEIIIQPTYFRTSTHYILKFNGYPVLRPELIFPNLLKSDDARVRLATIFLLPYIQPDLFYSQVQRDKRIFLTTVYLLFTLHEFLQEESQEKARVFFKTWFYNFDRLDHEMSFDRFLKIYPQIYPKKKASDTFFRSLQKTWKKQNDSFSKWDRAADIVSDRLVTFHPKSLGELTSIEA
jgi:DNA-binding transcriptional ArsR family regulator